MNLFKQEIAYLKERYAIYRSNKARKRAIRLAEYMSKEHRGSKFVVFRQTDGVYQVFNRDNFIELRRNRRSSFHKSVTWNDVLNDCVYQTTN